MAGDDVDSAPAFPRVGGFSHRAKVISIAAVVVAGLIAGLVAWSPWKPNPPAHVHATSPTATSALVSWRTAGGLMAIGTPAWGVQAIIASELLGPPLALRSRATSGTPHAF